MSIDRLANGAKGTLKIAADLKSESTTPAGLIQAKADGKYEFFLEPAIVAKSIAGENHRDVTKEEGG